MRAIGLVVAAALVATGHAHAAPESAIDACADASEKGQLLRIKGQLRAAREEFLACVKDACPSLVRKDCAQFLVDLDSSTPTIVLAARDAEGADLADVRVTVEGVTISDRLDGKAIAMDPGIHRFRFAAKDRVAAEITVVVREGERNRVIAATLVRTPAPVVTSPPPPPPPVAAWIAASVSLVGLGAFTVLGLSARSDFNGLQTRCGSRCFDEDVDPVRRKALFADIGLGVGLLGAGVATYLFVDHARRSSVRATLGAGYLGVVAIF